MTIEQLYNAISQEFPTMANAGKIFFDHIEVQDGQEITPPYIVLTEINLEPFHADNTVYYLSVAHTVDLYTAKYEARRANKIGELLTRNQIPYNSTVEYMDEIDAYLTSFAVDLDPSEVNP